jgi:pimeloyl-ACP methyl ester carboxylesterase
MPVTSPQRLTLQAGPLRLAARVWPGPAERLPLVLLHGLTASAATWTSIGPLLAARRTVIAWDARGHGDSEWSPDAAYAGDAHFSDLALALDALGLARCALAGFSMGGGVAILAAGALPERVARLVVIDAYPDPAMSPGSLQIARMVATYVAPDAAPSFDPAIARAFADQLALGDAHRLDLWPFWEAGTQPALIVRGGCSDVLTEAMAAEMLHRRPSAALHVMEGVAHAIPALRPRELAARIDAFLGDC